LAAAAANLRRLISAALPQAEQLELDRKLQPAWNSLTEKESKSSWAEGAAMSLEEAISYSREEPEAAISS
jgi:hypothetical protein